MELKFENISNTIHKSVGFNRTFMELKSKLLPRFISEQTSFNRTFMELKLIIMLQAIIIGNLF